MNFKIGLAEILFYYTNNKKNNTKFIYIFMFSTEWMNETHPTHP